MPSWLKYCFIFISPLRLSREQKHRTSLHVTVHRVKFLIIKPTRSTNFSNLFLEWNSMCFGQFLCPPSGVFRCTHSNGICHTGLLTACEQDQDGSEFHPDLVCTMKNSWWWTEELSETCRVSFRNKNFEKLVHLVGFIIRNKKLC